MKNSIKNLLLLLVFSMSAQFVSAQLSLRVVPRVAISDFIAAEDCYKMMTDILYSELDVPNAKDGSRTFCRVFFNEDGQVTDVRVRTNSDDPAFKGTITKSLHDISYCYAPFETKDTEFSIAFVVWIE